MSEQQQQQSNPNDLTIQDLATMKGIIDIASERSAFKPNEMAAVGIVYNKLELFLDEVQKQAEAAKAAGEAAPAATPAASEAPAEGEEAA
jgi:succinylarginine dihydrolase